MFRNRWVHLAGALLWLVSFAIALIASSARADEKIADHRVTLALGSDLAAKIDLQTSPAEKSGGGLALDRSKGEVVGGVGEIGWQKREGCLDFGAGVAYTVSPQENRPKENINPYGGFKGDCDGLRPSVRLDMYRSIEGGKAKYNLHLGFENTWLHHGPLSVNQGVFADMNQERDGMGLFQLNAAWRFLPGAALEACAGAAIRLGETGEPNFYFCTRARARF